MSVVVSYAPTLGCTEVRENPHTSHCSLNRCVSLTQLSTFFCFKSVWFACCVSVCGWPKCSNADVPTATRLFQLHFRLQVAQRLHLSPQVPLPCFTSGVSRPGPACCAARVTTETACCGVKVPRHCHQPDSTTTDTLFSTRILSRAVRSHQVTCTYCCNLGGLLQLRRSLEW